jgi:PEP-CTERM motif
MTSRIMRGLLVFSVGCCLPCAGSIGAQAAPIRSDSLAIIEPTGAVFATAIATEADEAANGPNFIYILSIFSPTTRLIDPATLDNPTQVLEASGAVSDVFGIFSGVAGCLDPAGLCLGFASDTDLIPVSLGNFPTQLPEGNGIFDATRFLDAGLRAQGFTAQFVSDVEGVPEPATIFLLGLSMAAGLAVVRRRLKA